MPQGLVECVPNFSEGRDRRVIEAIADAVRGVDGVNLLDVDPGADAHRTVYTFAGAPEAVLAAAFAAAARAAELIDLSRHLGAHPRIGAMDVCPFVPIAEVTLEECAALARRLGERVGRELDVPVYLYEAAAGRDERRSLSAIRAGEYEGLPAKLKDPAWRPDFGPPEFRPRSGAFVIGAREVLIAYNVNLNTRDERLAHEVALSIREAGRAARDAQGRILRDAAGEKVRVKGRLKAVRAIGWYLERHRRAQVSINLLDYKTTPLQVVFEAVKEEAEKRGLRVTGSEIVGLVPREAILAAGRHYLRAQGKSPGAPERELVESAVKSLGLSDLSPFEPEQKIIEARLRPAAKLASRTLADFADALSSDAPTPGGGSAAALAGALSAALAAMVANLTVGKKGLEEAWEAMADLSTRAQAVKDALLRAVDEDAAAFDRYLSALRLPRGTPERDAARKAALAGAAREATAVPLTTARLALEAISLAVEGARRGNPNAVSDAGAAAHIGRAAVESALLNVRINAPGISDAAFREACRRQAEEISAEASRRLEEAGRTVAGRLGEKS